MHTRSHKGPHGRFVTPHRPGPESTISIAKDGNGEASRRPLGLTGCADGLENERRQVSPTPNRSRVMDTKGISPTLFQQRTPSRFP
jgi:hypothetical protein